MIAKVTGYGQTPEQAQNDARVQLRDWAKNNPGSTVTDMQQRLTHLVAEKRYEYRYLLTYTLESVD